jgi:hypothetical protein
MSFGSLMQKVNLHLFAVCLTLFLFSYQANLMFWELFNLPFGMSDVDAYSVWLGQLVSYRLEYYPPPLSHVLFVYISIYLGGLKSLLWFTPLLLCFVMPFSLYYFYRSLGLDDSDSFWSIMLFIFGTFSLLYFSFTAVYCQILAFMFFILSLIAYTKRSWISFIVLMILTIVSHYMTLLVYGILFLFEILRAKEYRVAIAYAIISFMCIIYYGLLSFTTIFSSYTLPEPSLYIMLFVFSCPFFIPILFFTKLNMRFNIFFILLLIITPFTQGGRGLPFMHMFLAPYVLSGYKNVRKLLPPIKIIDYVFAIMVLLWFGYFFSYMAHNMTLEFVFRGLDALKLRELGFYIPLLNN